MYIALALVTAFTISFVGCWMITASTRLRVLGNVAPVDDRWHQQATPGLGGIPIYLSFCIVTCGAGGLTPIAIAFLVSAVPLLVIGLWDDLKPVRPGLKLAAQFFSASVFLLFAISPLGIPDLFGKGHPVFLMIGFILGLVWIVAIINAINLLDNMDGLAGGIAMIACLTLAFLIYRSSEYPQISLLLVILAASIGGFLVLNVKPAKLFMGDAGALWIGLVVGSGALIAMQLDSVLFVGNGQRSFPMLENWLLALMVCAVPISDTLMVIITRKLRGQAVSVGGRDHLSHRLVAIGFGERIAVAILWIAAIIGSLLALSIQTFPSSVWMAPVVVYLLFLLVSIVWLVRLSPVSVPTSVSVSLPHGQRQKPDSGLPESEPSSI